MSDDIPVSVFYLLLASGGFLHPTAATMYQYDVLLLYVFMYMYGSVIDNSEVGLFGWILYYVRVHYKWCPHADGDEMRW